jgi:hypothetical protein
MILPKDDEGRHVIYCDYCQANKWEPYDMSLRCFFYLCSVVAEDSLAQEKGIRVVYVSDSLKMKHVHDLLGFNDFIEKALPLHIHSLHIVVCTARESAGDERSFKSNTSHSLSLYLRDRTTIMVASNGNDALTRLKEHGFTERCLPESLGGLWRHKDWKSWLDIRLQKEKNYLRSSRSHQRDDELPNEAADSKPPAEPLPRLADVAELAVSHEQDKDLNKRKMGIIYSRRKRERRKLRVETLQDQVNQVIHENEALKQESTRLEFLLKSAKDEIEKYEDSLTRNHHALSQLQASLPIDVSGLFSNRAEAPLHGHLLQNHQANMTQNPFSLHLDNRSEATPNNSLLQQLNLLSTNMAATNNNYTVQDIHALLASQSMLQMNPNVHAMPASTAVGPLLDELNLRAALRRADTSNVTSILSALSDLSNFGVGGVNSPVANSTLGSRF